MFACPAAALLTFLAIEFIDELVDGVGSAAWPIVRSDLDLTYVQIGLLLSVPEIVASFVAPFMGVLGDVGYRRLLVLGGGLAFAASLVLVVGESGLRRAADRVGRLFPASGAFVSLSQASLMDAYPTRREQNMARWTFTGSVGNVLGPLALTAAIALGLGWREAFLAIAVLTIPAIFAARRIRLGPAAGDADRGAASFVAGMRTAISALRRFAVVKWLALLQASDLMFDTLKGFLALYMVDVVGVSESSAALTLAVWVGVGLVGDLLLIPLLDRVRGLTYLRFSVAAVLLLYPTFLLVPSFELKLAAIGLLGVRERGMVLDPSRAGLLVDAGSERHDRGARQRLRTRGLPGPTRAGRLRRQMGTRHGHVAALRRARAALHRHCANRAQQHCAHRVAARSRDGSEGAHGAAAPSRVVA